jgi:hypothetical protein
MNSGPYTLQEAEKLCKEFQYLVGMPFAKGSNVPIQSVTPAPTGQVNRERFIIYYLLLNNPADALKQAAGTSGYDILIFAGSEEQQLLNESLDSWLDKNRENITSCIAAIPKSVALGVTN